MGKKNINIDMGSVELCNLVRNNAGRLQSRPAYTALQTASAGEEIIYSATVRSNSGQVYYYTFKRTTATQDISCELRTNEYLLVATVTLPVKSVNNNAAITHATTPYNQVVFNSPGWSAPLFAYIGSSPIIATKVESINPDTPALPLPAGLVCSFGDRVVWAFGNIAYISSATFDPRTITATNIVAVAGTITDIFTGPDGNLIVVSTAETRVADQQGLTSAIFDGRVEKLNNYRGLSNRNAVSCRQGSFGMSVTGLIDLASTTQIPLTNFKRTRKLTDVVGPGYSVDYRSSGRMFSFAGGIIISFGATRPICIVNFDEKFTSWWLDTAATGELTAVSELDDGTLMLTYSNAVYAVYGNNPQCICALAGEVKYSGADSNNIRDIIVTTLADGVQSVTSYVRNSTATEVPLKAEDTSVTGTDLWGTATLISLEMQSVSMLHHMRADSPFFEVQIGRDTEIQDIVIELDGQGGTTRHRQ